MKIHKIKIEVSILKNEEEKNENLSWKTEEKKKWTKGAVAGTYMTVLSMNSLTDIKLIIILIYSVSEVSKIRR
jgi:phosphoribosyl-AMP cyclohydrolase